MEPPAVQITSNTNVLKCLRTSIDGLDKNVWLYISAHSCYACKCPCQTNTNIFTFFAVI